MDLKKELSLWFTIHFVIDVIFAAALFAAPAAFLGAAGWRTVDPIASRLVAAALFGIGIESLLARKSTLESFKSMLTLKVIWSATAVLGIGISLIQNAQGRPLLAYGFFVIFILFNFIWSRFLIKVGRVLK